MNRHTYFDDNFTLRKPLQYGNVSEADLIAMSGSSEMSGIGDIFKKIAGVAAPFAQFIPGVGPMVSAGLQTVSSIGGSSGGGVAKGLDGITNYGNQLMQALAQIESAVSQPNSDLNQLVSSADALAASLSDSSKVYQAKNGKDAAALQNFKSQAAAKVESIKAAAAQSAQRQQSAFTAAASGSIGAAGDLTTMMMFGFGGLALLMFLKR